MYMYIRITETHEAVAAYPISLMISASSIENYKKRKVLEGDGERYTGTCTLVMDIYMYVYIEEGGRESGKEDR